MSSLTLWKARTLVLHGFLLLVEALFWLSIALILLQVHLRWIGPLDTRSLAILAFGLVGGLLLYQRTKWPYRRLYTTMDRSRAKGTPSPFLLDDVLSKRGHFPDPERYTELNNSLRRGQLPHYPFYFFAKQVSQGLIWPLLITFLALLSHHIPFQPSGSPPIRIELTPPDYLGLPGRLVDPREKELRVFPGTLIRLDGLPSTATLKDNQSRQYLSKKGPEGWAFEARILSPVVLQLTRPDHQLNVDTLADHPPTVHWTKMPEDLDFRLHSIAFDASDDHGLQETLVNVNGQEIEYAGDSQGQPRFSYRWDFDPTEHRPLLGGNVVLRISAYDNDRVGGPKRTLSPPIIWTFPGIQHLARMAIEKVQSTREATSKRLDPKDNLPAEAVLQEVMEMAPLLKENPALSSTLQGLNQAMALQLSSHVQNDSGQPTPEESNLHQRHKWTLDMIEKQARKILGTIEASKWVKRLQEIADRASREEVGAEEWSELYEELQDHFQKTDTHPAFREEMMRKFNQAELASQMGDPETSSKLLEEMAEQMRAQPSAMDSSGPNPLAEKFQKLMADLQGMIQDQDQLLTKLNQPREALQDLQLFRLKLPQHSAWQAYQNWRNTISGIARRGGKIPPTLQERAYRKNDPVALGRILHQIYSGMTMVLTNRKPLKPWPTKDSLPDDLQQPWEKILPTLERLSGVAYAPTEIANQEILSEKGAHFREDFEGNIAPLLPGPNLSPLARQGETSAQQAHLQMGQNLGLQGVRQNMQAASTSWKSLLQQLQRLQQAAQQAAGQQQQSLSIGEDGKLQLSQQGQPQNEGDGRYDQRDQDIEIPLPEDFQSNKAIEERLQESLRKTRDEEEMFRFKDYMLDLLE